jgi:hypothetical protein
VLTRGGYFGKNFAKNYWILVRSLVIIFGNLISGYIFTWFLAGYWFLLHHIIINTILFADMGLIIAVLFYLYKDKK